MSLVFNNNFIKIIISLFLVYNISFGELVNKIAFIVNNEPITLYDIDEKATQLNISKQEALDIIIEDILYKQELKKNGIELGLFDVDDYIKKLAKVNNLTLYEFKNVIKQQTDYDIFLQDIKKRILHQKLIQKIAANKIKLATKEDLKIYYNNHKENFKIPKIIDFSKYQSKNKALLLKIKQNRLFFSPDIKTKFGITKNFNEFSDEVKFIILKTKQNSFSPIFIEDKHYTLYFINKKEGFSVVPFKDVKHKIFQVVMKQREDEFLKDYFIKLKLRANIIKN